MVSLPVDQSLCLSCPSQDRQMRRCAASKGGVTGHAASGGNFAFRVSGFAFRVSGFGFRVLGFGFRVRIRVRDKVRLRVRVSG